MPALGAVTVRAAWSSLPTVTPAEVAGLPSTVPSLGVTVTVMTSPASPLPGTLRSSVEPVSPVMAIPLRAHSYVYVTASPSGSWLVTVVVRSVAVCGLAWSIATESITGAELGGAMNSYAPRSSYVRVPAPVLAVTGSSIRAFPSMSTVGSFGALEFALSMAGEPAVRW